MVAPENLNRLEHDYFVVYVDSVGLNSTWKLVADLFGPPEMFGRDVLKFNSSDKVYFREFCDFLEFVLRMTK